MTKNEDRINKLFKELVPDTGKADSLAGELVRAMSRIGYRFYNDGDQLGIGYGKETCNPAGRFLGAKGNDKIAKLTADAWAVYSEEAYEKVLDILCGAVADYVEQNPDLRNQPTEDMWDFKDEEEDQDVDIKLLFSMLHSLPSYEPYLRASLCSFHLIPKITCSFHHLLAPYVPALAPASVCLPELAGSPLCQ